MAMNFSQDNIETTEPTSAVLPNGIDRRAVPEPPRQVSAKKHAYANNVSLDEVEKLLAALTLQNNNKSQITENLNATIQLLKHSDKMLKESENEITQHHNRIEDLEKRTTIDEVSGLLNRRAFIGILQKEVARTKRNLNNGGLLVMFNIENLALVRNRYTKEAANMAIRLVAKALQSEIRTYDTAARVLDDEFVLLLSETSMEKALSRLQNMAMRLNKLSLIWHGEEISLNLSLGLKSFDQHDDAQDIFRAASDDLKRNRKG